MKTGYKVIEILDEYSLIINYGETHGAEKGQEIRVIAIGPEISDPNTDEILGTLDKIKSILSITTVYKNFSICQKIENVVRNSLLDPLSQFQVTTQKKRPLNVDEKDMTHKTVPDEDIIKPGDPVEIL